MHYYYCHYVLSDLYAWYHFILTTTLNQPTSPHFTDDECKVLQPAIQSLDSTKLNKDHSPNCNNPMPVNQWPSTGDNCPPRKQDCLCLKTLPIVTTWGHWYWHLWERCLDSVNPLEGTECPP